MKIINRRAPFDYELKDRLEAGINLTGAEVKAVKQGKADLTGSFVKVLGSEVYLLNAKILPYIYARPENYEQNRTRKLLLHKKEINLIKAKSDGSNLTIVPVSMYTKRNLIKVEIALARGKKQFEKRAAIKKRDIKRGIEEEFRTKLR